MPKRSYNDKIWDIEDIMKRESKRLDENYFVKDEVETKLLELQLGTKTDLESFCKRETFEEF